ncbi:cystathionine gamma-synthase [Leucobacter weissii]|uniref:Cystathionine gamma-synthase n=1 Tax=Leucobacter weissii TaxID=1983706 RepID=A0A939MLT0_9MICO|nr:cystathionine gamma-synthase [Leucobacter weissii]MBO1903098.1 cystathionine gamma-synthase [Leucobacter weissii]
MTHSAHDEPSGPAGFDSLAIHAGQAFDPTTGAVIPPVYLSSTFVQRSIGDLRGGYEYSRSANPTRTALEQQLAGIERGAHGLSFPSGLAAEDALLRTVLRPGDEVLTGNDLYGGTYRLLARVLEPWGIAVRVVDTTDLDAVRAELSASPAKVLWIETPSNPLLRVSDIAALSSLAHEFGALAVVDNTFATPALQQPLALGADAVVHSATKYLGGHSDVIGGAIVLNDDELAERLRFVQNSTGSVSGPLDAWLTSRGIKTLGVRVQRHSENALAVARFLEASGRVAAVHYPGLASHPDHELARRQLAAGFGGIVSVSLGSSDAARRFTESAGLFQLAESLGGVESLANYPHAMTHASLQGTELAVPDDLVRLSVGIESVDDLLRDLGRALDAADGAVSARAEDAR